MLGSADRVKVVDMKTTRKIGKLAKIIEVVMNREKCSVSSDLRKNASTLTMKLCLAHIAPIDVQGGLDPTLHYGHSVDHLGCYHVSRCASKHYLHRAARIRLGLMNRHDVSNIALLSIYSKSSSETPSTSTSSERLK